LNFFNPRKIDALDHKLSNVVFEGKAQALTDSLDETGQTRLLSLSGLGANEWLNAIPSMHTLHVDAEVWVDIARFTLGFDVLSADPSKLCLCKHSYASTYHLGVCLRKGGQIHRHDHFNALMSRLLRDTGKMTQLEPTGLYGGDTRTKPDLLIMHAGPDQSHILWDASFTSPLQPLNLSYASRKQYFNAKIRFDTKNNKHQPLIPYGYSFMPIVVETYGAIYPPSFRALKSMCPTADADPNWLAPNWATRTRWSYWRQVLSVVHLSQLARAMADLAWRSQQPAT
jgi:hypothetical protein